MSSRNFHKYDNAISVVVATNSEQLLDAYSVRSICFMEEKGIPARSIFDGNDFQATHIVVYSGDEPIGSTRLRWFNNFVKMERTAVRKAYRNTRVLHRLGSFAIDHAARKGYTQAITLAEAQYAKIWTRLFGWREIGQRPPTVLGDGEQYIELIREFEGAADPLTADSDSKILLRIEGYWDQPTALETSF
jgi:predicted GNAT family N-acyltransferase